MNTRRISFVYPIICLLLIALVIPGTAQASPSQAETDEPPPPPRIGYSDETGLVTFIGADPEAPIQIPGAEGKGMSASDRTLEAVRLYGAQFGISNPDQQLTVNDTRVPAKGRLTVKYQQVHAGVPVLGGELIVNMTNQGELLSMNGEIAPDLNLSVDPQISAAEAQEVALSVVAKAQGVTSNQLTATKPELWIFDEQLLLPSTRSAELVWRLEVKSVNKLPINELVLINALTGGVSLHFNQVDTTWYQQADQPTPTPTAEDFLGEDPPQEGVSVEESALEPSPTPSPTAVPTEEEIVVPDPVEPTPTETGRDSVTATFSGSDPDTYASPSGSISADCSTPVNACKSIGRALSFTAPGGTVYVAEGTYTDYPTILNSGTISGGWSADFSAQNNYSTWTRIVQGRMLYILGGDVTITNFHFYGGHDSVSGGGIYVQTGANLALINSTMTNNEADVDGGALYVNTGASLTLVNSAMIDNEAASSGGAIYVNTGGTATIENVTFSGNDAYNYGGAIVNLGTTTLNNVTISENDANGGGGALYNYSGTLTIQNTIISGNTSGGAKDCLGTITSGGYNLIGDTTGCDFTPGAGDITNTSAGLEALDTDLFFYSLDDASPAIDAGNPATPGSGGAACKAYDQIDIVRPIDGDLDSISICDIGAIEDVPYLPTIIEVVAGSPQMTIPNSYFPDPFEVRVTDALGNGISGATVTFTAPETGPSGYFAGEGGTTFDDVTNIFGIAIAPNFVANGEEGDYVLTVSVSGTDLTTVIYLSNAYPVLDSITVYAGSPQTTQFFSYFPDQLQVLLLDNYGDPFEGETVIFTAPVSGPSGTFADTGTNTTTAITNAGGVATASVFSANGIAGGFTVDATASGLTSPAVFYLTNSSVISKRFTYTANNGTSLPGTLLCTEEDVSCTSGANPHADAAHTYAADTHTFYYQYHHRDSIDNNGMPIISSVHFSNGYQNAFWNGEQMVYGDAFGYPLADDVVAHELTHGVTNYESDLFYYYQSGAISESLSDIWGEFVDQTNGAGNDSSSVKWLIGEDISGLGPIRDMADPPNFSDPDRMTSSLYYTDNADLGFFGDNGGVHTNSGVNNKAVYLMTDGGSFNGYSVDGIGIEKVAAIYYEVQTNLLTSASDYKDLYNMVYQACRFLEGGPEGITFSDCFEVRHALNAVEMNEEPVTGYNPDGDLCPSIGQVPIDLFYDDFETETGDWIFGATSGASAWNYSFGYSTSGDGMLWGDDFDTSKLSYIITPSIHLPSGETAYLYFNHAFGFEDPDFDGGWLSVSINGGGYQYADTYFEEGLDFTGQINVSTPYGDNQYTGTRAFIGDSHGYVSSRYNLGSLANQNVRFRWNLATDSSVYDWGWFLDDVRIYYCESAGRISGHVYGPDGTTPLRGAKIVAEDYSVFPPVEVASTTTDFDGVYFLHLLPGEYKVYANYLHYDLTDEYDGGFSREYYNNALAEDAETISVVVGDPVTDINFTLNEPVLNTTFMHIIFNMHDSNVGYQSVRQAIAYGTDRAAMLANLGSNQAGHIIDTYMPEEHWGEAGNSDLTVYPYNPTMAETILDAAGFIDTDDDGIRDESGSPLSVILKTYDSTSILDQATVFKDNMEAIGIDVTIQQMVFADLVTDLEAGNFQMILLGWSDDYMYDQNDDYHVPPDYLMTDNDYNNGDYNNPAADAEVVAAQAETTRVGKLSHVVAHQTIVTDDLPWFFMYTFTEPHLANLTNPAEGATITERRPTLDWEDVLDAKWYRVQLSTSADFSSDVLLDTWVTDSEYDFDFDLYYGLTYFWRVYTNLNGFDEEQWSDVWSFSLDSLLDPPTLVSPIDDATLDTGLPEFIWEIPNWDPEQYKITIEQVDGGNVVEEWLDASSVCGASTCNWQPLTGLPPTDYLWSITGYTSGVGGSRSEVRSLTLSYVPCYELTISVSGSGATPTASPTNSSGCDAGEYVAGESITLSGAAPDSGWQITGWMGTDDDASTVASNTVTMPASVHSAGVIYEELPTKGIYDDTAAGFSYSAGWSTSTNTSSYDGSYRYTSTPGASATFTFYGDDFSILYTGHTSRGEMDVYIDDILVSSFSQYTPALIYQAQWDYPGTLGLGKHTLRLEHGDTSSKYVSLDALIIYQEGAWVTCYALTVSANGSGSTPTASPTNSTGCPAGEYVEGESITLSGASPDSGWQIIGWAGTDDDMSTASTNMLTMPADDQTAGVIYEEIANICFTLTITKSGQGSLPTASPTNSTGCEAGKYKLGEVITLNPALPEPGWQVGGWTGTDNDMTRSSTNYVTMPASNHSAGPIYAEDIPGCYLLTVSASGSGTTPTASPANSSGCSLASYVAGELITLSGALPDSGWWISGWTGTDDDNSKATSNTITMPANNQSAGVIYEELPEGTIIYDDTDTGFTYSAGWGASTNGNAYNSSYHYTGIPGATATFDFYGDDFSIIYTGHTNRGEMDVYVDDVLVASFNQNTSSVTYHAQWDYPGTLSLGNHTLRLEHGDVASKYVSLDALIIYQTGAGPTCYALTVTATGSGATPSASPANSTSCDAGEYVFGESITLSGAIPDSGWQVSGWTGTDHDSSLASTNTLTMPGSAHSAGVVYTEIPGAGTYDDTDTGFSYSAGWSSSTKTSAYGGSYRYTSTPGASASFTFYGDSFSILYTGHTSRGEMDVYIDDVLVGTFSQYTSALTYQAQWDYPGTLSMDTHTLRLEHGDVASKYVSLDALIVYEGGGGPSCYELLVLVSGSGAMPTASPTNSTDCDAGEYVAGESITLSGAIPDSGWQISGWTGTNNDASTATSNTVTMPGSAHYPGVIYTEIPGAGTYDDTAAGFSYSAGWSSSTKAQAYGGSYRYTSTPGASTSFSFNGDGFSILYTGHTSRGEMDVYVDDVLVGTFSQYAAALTYQMQWDYPGTLTMDTHTLRLEHGDVASKYVSLDALIVYEGGGGPTCYALTVSATGNGATPTASPTNSSGCDAGEYVVGESVTLSGAAPDSGWQISGWTGTNNDASTATSNTVTMPGSAHAASVIYTEIPGAGTYDDTDTGFSYSAGWTTSTKASAYGGSYRYTSTPGASASFSFYGDDFSIVYTGHTSRGAMDVYVDDVLAGSFSQYAAALTYQMQWNYSDYFGTLSLDNHTLRLEHGDVASKYVSLDAVIITAP